MSSLLTCVGYGPYLWLLVVLYFLLAYMSEDILSPSDQEDADVVVQAIIGAVLTFFAVLWAVDVYANSRQLHLHNYASCSIAYSVYGALVHMTSYDTIVYSPLASLVLKCILLHISEVVVVCNVIICLLSIRRSCDPTTSSKPTVTFQETIGRRRPTSARRFRRNPEEALVRSEWGMGGSHVLSSDGYDGGAASGGAALSPASSAMSGQSGSSMETASVLQVIQAYL